MLKRSEYPILDFDDSKSALIDPSIFAKGRDPLPSDKLVISFFKDAIDKLIAEGAIAPYTSVKGENELIIYKYTDCDVLLIHGQIGCPATGGYLDELTGMGISKVMFCGGGGVLDKTIGVGELLIVDGSIRDEGFSYHYIEPSRVIYADDGVNRIIKEYLLSHNIPHTSGITWTTDAFYRETKDLIAYRKEEGARIVEMEQAGCLAVAKFRGIKYGAIIYGGDDVSGDSWDSRGWHSKEGVRYSLIGICKEIVKKL